MRNLFLILFVVVFTTSVQSQIHGKWTTIDDNSGEPRSVVEIIERGGKFFGKVIKIYNKPGEPADPVCDKCDEEDSRYKKKVIGMEILQDAVKRGEVFIDGHILDPENGKIYRCKLWLEGNNLKLRGYWGPFFRTQTWKREAVRP